MNVYIVYDDAYDRNVICVTTDYSVAVETFHNNIDELIANGYRPNVEQEKYQFIETHPLMLGKDQVITLKDGS